MVSILPPNISPWQTIGKAIGNLGRNAPELMEKRYQQQRGLNAIDQLQADLQSAEGDISKILPAIARAYTLNPALERSGIAEQALSRARTSAGTGAATNLIDQIKTSQGSQQLPGFLNQEQQQASTTQPQQGISPPQTQRQPVEGLFLSDYLPVNLGEQITPEQRAKTLDEVARNGGDVAAARQVIDDYNQGKINQNELANANVEKQAANVQRRLGYEDQIRQRIDKFVPEDTSESEKNIYYNMLRPALESKGVKSFADAWQKVSEQIDNFRKLNEAFVNKIPEAGTSFFGLAEGLEGLSPAQSAQQRNSAKPLMQIDPLAYNVIEQEYMQKGHSPITVAKTFKPTPENVKGIINTAADVKDLIYYPPYTTSEFGAERNMLRNIDKANEKQQQSITKLVPELRKSWSDDISLLNLYADLKEKGWQKDSILTLFDDVADLFSSRQKADRTTLNQDLRVPLRYLNFSFTGE